MTASKTEQLSSAMTKAADVLTAAGNDKSGLFSALVTYLEHNNEAGRSAVRQNAQAHGLGATLTHWQHERRPAATTEDIVQKLLPPSVIEHVAAQSGLSHKAALTSLTEVLPAACRQDEKEARTTHSG